MFADHFWGDKHNGFETLTQNLKHGEQSCKDIEEFVKQCSSLEDLYVKSLTRLIKSIGSYNAGSSFSPVWQTVKASFEKLSTCHAELSKKWKELSNDIHKYLESLGKKYKSIKDGQTTTLEAVQSMQSISTLLAKSKENYNSKFNDYKKVLSDKSTAKKLERCETDFKKATDEYKLNVGKYNATLDDYKKKMGEVTELFQENEVEYLSQMEQFVRKYTSIRDDKHTEIGELHYEFHTSLTELSVECLLDTFIETKGTGTEHPGMDSHHALHLSRCLFFLIDFLFITIMIYKCDVIYLEWLLHNLQQTIYIYFFTLYVYILPMFYVNTELNIHYVNVITTCHNAMLLLGNVTKVTCCYCFTMLIYALFIYVGFLLYKLPH